MSNGTTFTHGRTVITIERHSAELHVDGDQLVASIFDNQLPPTLHTDDAGAIVSAFVAVLELENNSRDSAETITEKKI